MARPRRGSPEALANKANETIEALLNDPKSPPEVRARLAVKVAEWVREDRKLEAQVIRLTAAREAELKQQGVDEYMAELAKSMNAAMAEIGMERPTYTAPVHADADFD